MTVTPMSHGDVYRFVLDHVGATRDERRLKVLMRSSLQELWAQVWDDPHYQFARDKATDNMTETGIGFKIFKDLEIHAIRRGLRRKNGAIDAVEMTQIFDDETQGLERLDSLSPEPGPPERYSLWNGVVRLYPKPDQNYLMEWMGYRNVDTRLHTKHRVRTWLPVDLPPLYHTAFSQAVLALAYLDNEDQGLYRQWLALASSELDSIARVKDAGDRTRGERLIRLGSTLSDSYPTRPSVGL
jgi:hypothetical protein